MKKVMLSTAVVVMLSGCQTTNAQSPQPIIGTVIGGAAGGILGNQVGKGSGRTAATAAGAVIGAIVGNHLGSLGNQPRQPQQQSYPVQGGYGVSHIYPECAHLTIPSEISSCQRGVSARKMKERVAAEQRAYRCGYHGTC